MRHISNLLSVLGMSLGLPLPTNEGFQSKPYNPNNSRGGPPEPFQETGNKPLISKRAKRRMKGKQKGKK